MAESNYSLFKEEDTRQSFPKRTILYATGAGFSLGIFLTVAIIYIFSSASDCSQLTHEICNQSLSTLTTTPTPASTTGPSKLQKEKVFTVFTDKKMNWHEALADCRRRGMDLAAVESEEEYGTVLSQITALGEETRKVGEDFWLSGTELGYEHVVWISTGRNVTYHKWYHYDTERQQPFHISQCDLSDEHCMEINQKLHDQWNIYCCSYRQFYICEQWN